MLQLTLTPVREDRPRYVVLVSYEKAAGRWPLRTCVIPVRRTWEWLEVRPGKWVLVCTRVTELRRIAGNAHREWPRKLEPAVESEDLRRARIRALRQRVHVDPAKGALEPDWDRAAESAEHRRVAHVDGQGCSCRGRVASLSQDLKPVSALTTQ